MPHAVKPHEDKRVKESIKGNHPAASSGKKENQKNDRHKKIGGEKSRIKKDTHLTKRSKPHKQTRKKNKILVGRRTEKKKKAEGRRREKDSTSNMLRLKYTFPRAGQRQRTKT